MRAAEAFWRGKDELFERFVDDMAPTQIEVSEAFSSSVRRTGSAREGVGFDPRIINKLEPQFVHFGIWKEGKMLDLVSEEASIRGAKSLEGLRKVLDEFKGSIKNELSSIKAASDRMQTEMRSMQDRYVAAQALLTSAEFERAVANAERMAAALKAIGELSETKLSVAVFSGSKSHE